MSVNHLAAYDAIDHDHHMRSLILTELSDGPDTEDGVYTELDCPDHDSYYAEFDRCVNEQLIRALREPGHPSTLWELTPAGKDALQEAADAKSRYHELRSVLADMARSIESTVEPLRAAADNQEETARLIRCALADDEEGGADGTASE